MMASKFDVKRSNNGSCLLCSKLGQELFLVREVQSGHLKAICGPCLLCNLDDYLLDNTRPWPFLDKRG